MTLVPHGQDVVDGDPDFRQGLAQRFQTLNGVLYLSLPLVLLGHYPGNGAAAPSDNNGLTALDIVEQLEQMGLAAEDWT